MKLRPKITTLFFVFLCAGCSADSQNELPDGAADAQDADGVAATDQDSPDGGDDTVENALGLCPNCHRELHFDVLD